MLGLAALVVIGVSFILNIVGLAIPYWFYASNDTTKITLYIGLWKSCSSFDDKCVDLTDVGNTIKAVRALEILGVVMILAALVCLTLKQFHMKEQELLPKMGGGCAIIAGLLMIVGTVLFATDSDLKLLKEAYDLKLHAGFALCIVAGILGIMASVMAIIGNKREP